VADCIAGDLEHGAIVHSVARKFLDDILLVSEEEILGAVHELETAGVRVEPGAAAAYAAVRAPRFHRYWENCNVCVVISGGP
jgi:threonine dehydratase